MEGPTVKALVTGASGFLGSHIVDECVRAGDHVRVLVRPFSDVSYLRTVPGLELVYGELGDTASLRDACRDVDVVYHSAARVTDHGTRAQFWAANVTGTERLLAAAADRDVGRFVFVSSPSATMTGGDQFDVAETGGYPTTFLNLYSETKAAAEQRVLAADRPGFTTCALRPRGIWGPRDYTGFLPRLLTRMRAGRLPDLSGGRQVLASLCHSSNAAQACRLAAEAPAVGGRAYFITDPAPYDLWALIAETAALFGVRPPARSIPPVVRDGAAALFDLLWKFPPLAERWSPPLSRYSVALLTRSTTYDIGAARRDLGYEPEATAETGLPELKAWVDSIGGLDAYLRRTA